MDIQELHNLAQPILHEFVDENFNVLLTTLCTEDGFVIGHKNSSGVTMDDDKVAAISSSLLSLAEVSVSGIRKGTFKRTIVESDSAHLLIVRAELKDLPVVLTIVATEKSSLAYTLFLASRLTDQLAEI